MILDKTLAFATEAELAKEKQLQAQLDALAKGYENNGQPETQTLAQDVKKINSELDRVREPRILRYAKSFNGNLEAILADAKEVIQSATEQDYIKDYNLTLRSREQRLKGLNPESEEYKILQSALTIGFMSCYSFMLGIAIGQIYAILHIATDLEQRMNYFDVLAKAAFDRAAEFYPPTCIYHAGKQKRATTIKYKPIEGSNGKAGRQAKPDKDNHGAELLAEKAALKDLLPVPTSPVIDLLVRALSWGRDVESAEIIKMREMVSHKSNALQIKDYKNQRRYITETGTEKVELHIDDISKLIRSKTAKKWLVLFLNKITEQALNNDGTLRDNHIFIEPREVVNNYNMYKSERAAVKAFLDVEPIFTSCKVKGYLKKGKNTIIEQAESTVLFTYMRYKRREGFTVDINPRVNWSMVCPFFTLIHKAYFSLPNRAADLLYLIFYRARSSTKEIKERGYFNISMRAVQERLGLPGEKIIEENNEKKNREPQRTIKEPIDAAITAIENAIQDADFTITPFYDMSAPITAFLEKGYLQIAFKGRYAEYFAELGKKANEKVTKATNRTEKAKEKALENYYLNKIEESAADQSEEPPKRKRGRPRNYQ